MSSASTPLHLVLHVREGLAPFADPGAATAARQALRKVLARHHGALHAVAILPAEVDVVLLATGEPGAVALALRRALQREVNRLLGRHGALFTDETTLVELQPDEVPALAAALAQRLAAEGPTDQDADPATEPRRAGAPQRVGDAISVAPVPTVVQLAEVRPLLTRATGDDEALTDYVGRWYLADRRALAAVRTVLRGLGGAAGGGWFVTGLYGAGKSHLLAACGLAAARGDARRALLAHHPELDDLRAGLEAAGDRLVVAVPLDEEPPTRVLEDVVFRAAADALYALTGQAAPLAEVDSVVAQAREHLTGAHLAALDAAAGGSWSALATADPARAAELAQTVVRERGLPFEFRQSRVERLGRLLELASAANRRGVVFLLDELSLFLGAKDQRAIQGDAGFLQFLGQRGAHQPVWTIGALQRQIEDVGDVEHYTLRQIKDRYETRLNLPLSAAKEVLAHKVLRRSDARAFTAAVETTHRAWTGGARLADWSLARLREVYPLHPLTFVCLESCAERFLARTRSILEFALARVAGDELAPGVLDQPVPALVTPDALWDHFAKDVAQHPDLRRYREVVADYYRRNLPALVGPADLDLAQRLVKLLLVLALSGIERGVRDLAAALAPASEEHVARVAGLCETLRRHGAYLTVERRPSTGNDVYRLDLEYDVNETLRRRARALAETLTVGDGRLTSAAVDACRTSAFPLAAALHAHSAPVVWRNTNRSLFVALRDLTTVSAAELTNQAALLAGRELDEAVFVYIAEPQRVARQQEAFTRALAEVSDPRWRHALLAWVPREASDGERAAWVDDASLELVRADPGLRAGDPLRVRLDEDAEPRRARLAELLGRLYRDGVAVAADSPRDVGPGEWRDVLARLAGYALEGVFPDFARVAPQRHVVSKAGSEELIRELVLPGEVVVAPATVLAEEIADWALPLGIAQGEEGRYRVQLGSQDVWRQLLDVLPPHPTSLAAVESWLAKSSWGLVPELAQLLVAAMARRGYLDALDDAGRPATLGVPLHAAVALVQPAGVVDAARWAALRPMAQAVFGRDLGPVGPGAQQALAERFLRWREASLAGVELVRAGCRRAAEALGHVEQQWREALDLAARLAALVAAVPPCATGRDTLLALSDAVEHWPAVDVAALVAACRSLVQWCETGLEPLLACAAELGQAVLPADSPLGVERDALLARLAEGDRVAFEGEALLADLARWRQRYGEAYSQWHADAHAAARFVALDRFRQSPPAVVLTNLSRLALDVPDNAAALMAAWRAERVKQCRRGDLAQALRGGLVCPECGLPLGGEVRLRPLTELEAVAHGGIAELLERLRAPEPSAAVREGLAALPADDPRLPAARVLLESPTPDLDVLLPASAFAVIDLLNTFLTTRVVAQRSLTTLAPHFEGQRLTKDQARGAFDRWLDPTDSIGRDALIEFGE